MTLLVAMILNHWRKLVKAQWKLLSSNGSVVASMVNASWGSPWSMALPFAGERPDAMVKIMSGRTRP